MSTREPRRRAPGARRAPASEPAFRVSEALRVRESMLCESTLRVFSKAGCFRTRTEDIVGQVGVGKSSLYRHHATRVELFEAASDSGAETLRIRCLEISRQCSSSPAAAMKSVIAELLRLNEQHSDFAPEALLRLRCCGRWMVSAPSRRSSPYSWIGEVVEFWKMNAVIDSAANAEWVAAVVVALTSSQEVGATGLVGPSQAADRIVDLLQRTFGARSPARPETID
jgi:AcrR family transcriptional regulator